jgi:osmotically-inducible protein OsmY
MKRQARIGMLVALVLTLWSGGAHAERTAGETLDDGTLTAKVKIEIARSEGLREAVAVNVDTYRGEVQLAGFVDDEAQKLAAEEAAKRVDGVQRVINNLQVKKR